MTKPILSFGRLSIKLTATSLAASSRLGFKSCASIDAEISRANTISIPSVLTSCHDFLLCGRAKQTMRDANANKRNMKGTCKNFNLIFFWRKSKNAMVEIFTSGCILSCFHKYQTTNNGNTNSSQKAHGFTNEILFRSSSISFRLFRG